MASKFNELFDSITLSGEKTDEILRKVKTMKNTETRDTLGAKRLYVTLAAAVAAIALTIFGGSWLINSGVLQRAPYDAGSSYTTDPEVALANEIAAAMRNQVTYFFQDALHSGEVPEDNSGVFALLRHGESNVINFIGWDNQSNITHVQCKTITEDITGFKLIETVKALFEHDERFQPYRDVDNTFVFIIEDNVCTHAAFFPDAFAFETINIATYDDDMNRTLSSVISGRLSSEIWGSSEELLSVGRVVGTSPAQDYPWEKKIAIVTSADEARQIASIVISADEAGQIASDEADKLYRERTGDNVKGTVLVSDMPVLDTDSLVYKVSGTVGDLAGEPYEKFEAKVNAITGEIISLEFSTLPYNIISAISPDYPTLPPFDPTVKSAPAWIKVVYDALTEAYSMEFRIPVSENGFVFFTSRNVPISDDDVITRRMTGLIYDESADEIRRMLEQNFIVEDINLNYADYGFEHCAEFEIVFNSETLEIIMLRLD
jgi:hypothetical protein